MRRDLVANLLASRKATKVPGGDISVKSARNLGIDAFRYCLAFLVIMLHSLPVAEPDPVSNWHVWVQIACRSAVPFFFIASGYFLSPERQGTLALVANPLQRLLPVYAFWMAIYFVYLNIYPFEPWRSSPKDLVSGGAAFHLWFLPALGFGLALAGVGVRTIGLWGTGIVCLGLAAVGLALSSYHGVLGLEGEAQRGGALVAPAFVLVGLCLSRVKLVLKPAASGILIIISLVMLIAEEFLIWNVSGAPRVVSHDFTFSTLFLGASVFLFAKSLSPSPFVTAVAALGRISLGVYAAHMLFLWPLASLISRDNPLQVCAVAILVFILSTLLVKTLARARFMSRLIG